MSVITSQGTTLDIVPLLEQECSFLSFHSTEQINGPMASMEVVVETFSDIASVTDEEEITIVTQDGLSITCTAYVYSITYANGICTIKMMPVPADFMRTIYSSSYKGIENAIKIFPGNIDKSIVSNEMDALDLYQKSESSYSFLNKMLKCYKINTIFAYTLSGLVLRDLNEYSVVEELNAKGTTSVDAEVVQELSDPKRYSSDIEILAHFENHSKVRVHSTVYDINTEYETLLCNMLYFERFNSFKSSYSFSVKEILGATLCEGVGYYTGETNVDNTIVFSREINISNSELEVLYVIKSIDP